MPALILNDNNSRYECKHCDRSFNSSKALYQHCENTSIHSWCSSCQVTLNDYDELRDHKLWAEAHRTCEVCDEVFDNGNNLESHMIIHKEPDVKCVFCTRMFRSGSSMLIHLETGCNESHWNTAYTQDALMVFTEYHPTDYGINCNQTGPIFCGCEGKNFSKVSALCQHLESDACNISHRGSDVVDDLIDMMRDGVWQYSRKGNVKALSFDDVIVKWDAYLYR